MKHKICIIGLGYVGLPLAIEFSKYYKVVGYDKNNKRVKELIKGLDHNNEIKISKTNSEKILFTNQEKDLLDCNIFIITLPTPVKKNNIPDLGDVINGTKLVSKYISKNNFIIYESTFYPGLIKEKLVPIIEKISQKKINKEFYCGYSPERINPGDKKRGLSNIKKIVSGSNKYSLNIISEIYKKIIKAGVIEAKNIESAEAAKILENIQRDVNIALMNEVSIIFNKLNLDTEEVIRLASTKWNFHNYSPGLVGGHCISVDPYYLIHKANKVGKKLKLIKSAREVSEKIPNFIYQQIKKKIGSKHFKKSLNILILGFVFKKNSKDFRNSKVQKIIDIFSKKNNSKIDIYDNNLINFPSLPNEKTKFVKRLKNNFYDAIIITDKHDFIYKIGLKKIINMKNKNGIIFDIKWAFKSNQIDLRL